MPQTKAGQTILTKMIEEYGKKKGQSVFYGKVNKGKSNKFAKLTGEMSVRHRAGKK